MITWDEIALVLGVEQRVRAYLAAEKEAKEAEVMYSLPAIHGSEEHYKKVLTTSRKRAEEREKLEGILLQLDVMRGQDG